MVLNFFITEHTKLIKTQFIEPQKELTCENEVSTYRLRRISFRTDKHQSRHWFCF